jgi:CIC family chloride channel protein
MQATIPTSAPARPTQPAWHYKLKTFLGKSPLFGDSIPLFLSVLVGVITGFGAYIFIQLLEGIAGFSEGIREEVGLLAGVGLLALAGLLVGIIIASFAREAKGHGVPEVMEAIALRRGRIRPRVAIAKIVASAITIGTGGSAGREGPIVQVGATLGSTAGQWGRLSDEQISMLVASGAAAGIAATFNAPIAGTLFALEVILGRFTNRYLGIVVIAAVSANVVSRILLGPNPAFEVPAYGLNSPLELILYTVLGVLCALMAIAFIRVLYGAEHYVARLKKVPLPLITMAGMALTGVVGMIHPEALGPGLEFIGESIATDMDLTIGLMLALLALKLVATTFTLGTGNSGGVFAPGLFMGAMVGGIIGQLGRQFWPGIVIDPGAFALVGMSALFAGSARAPITAIIIVLEMSNDYRLILPLLLTVIISTLIADFLHPDTIYTRKLTLRGIRLERGQDIDLLQAVQVKEVLSRKYPTVTPETQLETLLPRFNLTHSHGFAIVDEDERLIGMMTLTDMERALQKGDIKGQTVMDAGTTTNLVTVYPDDPIYVALRRMNIYDIGRLPVISQENGDKYVGMVRRSDVLRAYDLGLARKSIEQHHEKYFHLRNIDQNIFIEVMVEPGAPMVGHTLVDFPCSDNCLIVSIQRQGKPMIAHGETVIQAGDIVTAYVYPEALAMVMAQFAPGGAGPGGD